MCGISGYWGRGNEDVLERMNNALSYRGPDDAGLWIHSHSGLAHRRLSILDLSPAGHQPMVSDDGMVAIAFNGEIYNFQELKKELGAGIAWKGTSDTEVILHAYEKYGEKVFEKIYGMFAIALSDQRENKLILARDRMGKKPLFWALHDDTFMFASELKALMEHPSFKKEISHDALNKYFLYENIPTPHCIFKNTYKVEPGSYVVWDGKTATAHTFWQPHFLPKQESFNTAMSELDASLKKAVSDRMVADVPVGVFLSGGLDSSTIAYYASRNAKIKTFSIGFKEPSFDESVYARKVAQALGTEHYEQILSVDEACKLVPSVLGQLDEPMADPSVIPTYILSRFARQHVTVALGGDGGDGGDELFCGYDTFTAHKLSTLYEKIPSSLRRLGASLVRHLPVSFANMSLDFKLKKFMGGFEGVGQYRNQRWLSPFTHEERGRLFAHDVWKEISQKNEFEDIDIRHAQCDSPDFYDKLGLEYERLYMMDQVLVKVDRASMFNSLEVRSPFLDTRVVDIAHHMPASFKFRRFEKKYILKKLMEGKLPPSIIYRKKKGFGMPVAEWLRGGLKEIVTDALSEKSLNSIGLFNPAYVKELLDDHIAMKKDNRKQLWTLLVFVLWWRRWM